MEQISFSKIPTIKIVLWGVIYALLVVVVYFLLNKKNKKSIEKKLESNLNTPICFVIGIALVGLIIRYYLAAKYISHMDVTYYFVPWTEKLINNPITRFYFIEGTTNIDSMCNYTPLYAYFLYLCGLIIKLFKIGGTGVIIVVKSPAIICDIISGIIIYKIAKKRNLPPILSVFFCGAYILNPALMVNSAVWGQIDGITAMFTILVVYLIMEQKDLLAIIFSFVGISFKLQFIFALPAIGMYYLIKAIKDKKLFKKYLLAVLIGVGVFFAISLPLTILPSITTKTFFPIKIYLEQIGTYEWYTLNAFNIYGLLGLNYVDIASGQSASVTAIVLIVTCIFIIIVSAKRKEEKDIPILIAITIGMVFTFTMKMHERYMFVIMSMVTIALINKKSKLLCIITALINVVVYLNVALIMNSENWYFDYGRSTPLTLGSILEIVSFVLLIGYFIYSTIIEEKEKILLKKPSASGRIRK